MSWINIRDYLDAVDSDGEKAGTIIITSNRSGGKTTSLLNYSLDYYKDTGRCMFFVYRKKTDSQNFISQYDDVLERRADIKNIDQLSIADGLVTVLTSQGNPIAYAACLKDIDGIKKYSNMFFRVDYVVLDEYQLEKEKYMPTEVTDMISLIISVSRGGGYSSRKTQLILSGNNYSLLNPYLMEFGISMRYRPGMRRLRGKGYVAYFIQNDDAKKQIINNPALKAFGNNNAIKYATESDFWIADDKNFITKPHGRTNYVCTLIYGKNKYGLWDCINEGYIYISKRCIDKHRYVFALDNSGHGTGVRLMRKNNFVWRTIQNAYDEGAIRFFDLECKYVLLQFLSKGLTKT